MQTNATIAPPRSTLCGISDLELMRSSSDADVGCLADGWHPAATGGFVQDQCRIFA
jgi:hypothetical protein